MSVAILLFGFPIANKYIILHNSIMVLTINFPKVAQHECILSDFYLLDLELSIVVLDSID
jgi:hypothetical protein